MRSFGAVLSVLGTMWRAEVGAEILLLLHAVLCIGQKVDVLHDHAPLVDRLGSCCLDLFLSLWDILRNIRRRF